jgi:hypothetical protein
MPTINWGWIFQQRAWVGSPSEGRAAWMARVLRLRPTGERRARWARRSRATAGLTLRACLLIRPTRREDFNAVAARAAGISGVLACEDTAW